MKNENIQLKETDTRSRQNEVVLKMSKRMSDLEGQLNDVQSRLGEAIKAIAERDEMIDNLKEQILQERITKLNQNPSMPSLMKHMNTQEGKADSLEFIDNYKKRKPKPKEEFIRNGKQGLGDIKVNSNEIKLKLYHNEDNNSNLNLKEKVFNFPKRDLQGHTMEPRNLADIGAEEIEDYQEVPTNALTAHSKSHIDSQEHFESENGSSYTTIEEDEGSSQEIEQEYNRLLKRVSEMEKFLGDYGLIWVGDVDATAGDRKVEASIGFSPNFDKVIMVIRELNDIISSESQIDVSENKGKFKKAEVLKLTLFSDGIQLEDNPFREYSSQSVQEFFHDLEDGYYPTELKESYPEGVIFKVVDNRSTTYEESKRKSVKPFSGKGHKLGTQESNVCESKTKLPPYPGPSGRIEERKLISGKELSKKNNKNGNDISPNLDEKVNKIVIGTKTTEKTTIEDKSNKAPAKVLQNENEISNGNAPRYNDKVYHTSDDSGEVVQNDVHIENINLNENKTPSENYSKKLQGQPISNEENSHGLIECKYSVSKASDVNSPQNVHFRDNINITNITYNEAPFTVMSPSVPNFIHQVETKDIRSQDASKPVIYAGQRDGSDVDNNNTKHYERTVETVAKRTPDETDLITNIDWKSSSPGRSYTNVPFKPYMTEYSEQFDENAKHISEAIQKRPVNSPKIIKINPDEEFEHFKFLGKPSNPDPTNTNEMSTLPNATSTGIMDKLPNEMLETVFSYLDGVDLCNVSMVCKRWCNIGRNENLWRNLCVKYNVKEEPDLLSLYGNYGNECGVWKTYYRLYFDRCKNWKNDKYVIHEKGGESWFFQAWSSFRDICILPTYSENRIDVFRITREELLLEQQIDLPVPGLEPTYLLTDIKSIAAAKSNITLIYSKDENGYHLSKLFACGLLGDVIKFTGSPHDEESVSSFIRTHYFRCGIVRAIEFKSNILWLSDFNSGKLFIIKEDVEKWFNITSVTHFKTGSGYVCFWTDQCLSLCSVQGDIIFEFNDFGIDSMQFNEKYLAVKMSAQNLVKTWNLKKKETLVSFLGSPDTSLVLHGSSIFLLHLQRCSLSCCDIKNGNVRWRVSYKIPGPHRAPLFHCQLWIILNKFLLVFPSHKYGTQARRFTAFDIATGKRHYTSKYNGMVVDISDRLLVTLSSRQNNVETGNFVFIRYYV